MVSPVLPGAVPTAGAAVPTDFPVLPGAVPAAGAAVPTDSPVSPDAVPAAEAAVPTDFPVLPGAVPAAAAVPTDFLVSPDAVPAAGVAVPTDFPVLPDAVPAAGAAVPTDFPVLPGAVPAADSMDGAPARSDSAHPPPTPYIQRFRPSVRPEVVHTIHHFQEDAAVCWFPPDSLLFLHQENLFSGNFPPSPFLLLWIQCPRPPPLYRSSVYPYFPFQPD